MTLRMPRPLTVLQVVVVCALPLFVWFLALRSDWAEPVARYIVQEGLPGTLRVAAFSVVGSTLIGIVVGTLITVHFWPLRALIRFYIEVFRGLPILVTVFIVYFGLPTVVRTLEFDPLTAATVALIFWGSAQVAEATRGAVQSIPHEQHEAASALGFGWVGRHRSIILPQALRRLLPPLVGLLVNLVQNSTLAQVIGGLEVLEAAERQNERITAIPPIGLGEIHAFQIFGGVMILFFVISFPLTRLAAMLERRLV
jgi:polar amino acid transport system permease protein